MITEPHSIPTLLTPRQFSEKHIAFSQGSVRDMLYKAEINGLQASGAIKRIGKKILIDESRFFLWIEEIQQPKVGG